VSQYTERISFPCPECCGGSPCSCPGIPPWKDTILTVEILTLIISGEKFDADHASCSVPDDVTWQSSSTQVDVYTAEFESQDDDFIVFRLIHQGLWSASPSYVTCETIESVKASGSYVDAPPVFEESRFRWNCTLGRWEMKGAHPLNEWNPLTVPGGSNQLYVVRNGVEICDTRTTVQLEACEGGEISGRRLEIAVFGSSYIVIGGECNAVKVTVSEVV
jgi:hypothetical protein